MKIGLMIRGGLDTVSGGYLFDRMLVAGLQEHADEVRVLSWPQRSYSGQLFDNLIRRNPADFDLVLQDELMHPSLLRQNARPHPCPIISIVHNLRSSERRSNWQNTIYRAVERRYLGSVDGFIFNSKVTRDSVDALVTTPRPSVIAAPGGDRLGQSNPDRIRRRADESGPLRLLFLANVTAGKGLGVALDALARLPAGEFALDVVGSCDTEPAYARKMRGKAARLGLSVVFHRVLDNAPLREILDRAQVLVVPSFYEGFGISYLEGMAHGLPAIGTTAGAIPDLISDGTNGYLISPGDSDALAGHLSRLHLDRPLLAQLGLSALRCFQARPTWRQSVEVARAFLAEMVAR